MFLLEQISRSDRLLSQGLIKQDLHNCRPVKLKGPLVDGEMERQLCITRGCNEKQKNLQKINCLKEYDLEGPLCLVVT